MQKEIVGAWISYSSLNQVWDASYAFPGGISRSLIIGLGDENFLVYSPGASLIESAQREILKTAKNIYLLEPNSFHNLGLSLWMEKNPGARAFSGLKAKERLAKKSGVYCESIEALQKLMPDHINLVEVPESKIGEVWITITQQDKNTWVVGDAFFNFSAIAEKGLLKWFMKLNRMGPGLETGRIFNIFGLADKKRYSSWLTQKIQQEKPYGLIPCHGIPIESIQLPLQLLDLVQRRY